MTEAAKQNNRDAFPFAAAKLDELRLIFGETTRIVWAEENGQTVGNKGPDGVRPTIEKRREK